MSILIILIGALILLAGLVIVLNPEIIFSFFQKNLDKLGLYVLASVLRIVLGILLITQSNLSKFPLVIEIMGWLSIIAAILLVIIGRRNFNRLMSWALSFVKTFGRVGGVLAMAFGAFLIYSFL